MKRNLPDGDCIIPLQKASKKIKTNDYNPKLEANVLDPHELKNFHQQQISKENDKKHEQLLIDIYTCPICYEIIQQCFKLHPCNHIYCGACIQHWIQAEKTQCPICKTDIHQCKEDKNDNRIIEMFLEFHPEKRAEKELIKTTEMYPLYPIEELVDQEVSFDEEEGHDDQGNYSSGEESDNEEDSGTIIGFKRNS